MFISKYVLRSLQKNKINTIINIAGLSIGIATFLLLALFIEHELGYDKQFSNYKNIYRITTSIVSPDGSQHLAIAPLPLKSTLKDNYPEVEEAGIVTELSDKYIIEYKDVWLKQVGFREASADIFSILDYRVLQGDLRTALKEPYSVVLTESLARKIFGDASGFNKTILLDDDPHRVTAILEDLPKNMDLQFSALLSRPQETSNDWLDFEGFLYVKLQPNGKKKFESILSSIENTYYKALKEELGGVEIKFTSQALSDIHFSNELLADSQKGNILYVYFFTIVGFIILLIACINYINLSFARLTERNYFEGICKINGANNKQSNFYLIQEALIQTFISLLISMVLILMLLPFLNVVTGKDIVGGDIINPKFIGIIFLVFLSVISLISALPIVFTAIFQRRKTILRLVKAEVKQTKSYRSSLVVLQFVFTVSLIVFLFTFQQQMNFMKKKDLGFDPQNIMAIETPFGFDTLNHRQINLFVDHLKNTPGTEKISQVHGGAIPGIMYGGFKMIHAAEIEGEMKQFVVSFCDVDHTYLNLMNIELIQGEGFIDDPNANNNKCIINETYAKLLGINNDPLGQVISETDDVVKGVVKDFHFLSPQNPIEPICIRYRNGYPGSLLIKSSFNVSDDIKALWKKDFPGQPLSYSYLEETYSQQYLNEKSVFSIVCFFTILSVLISVLGLSGLIRYTCERHVKEIGIRKVCGAKVAEIIALLNMEFVKKILIAFLIACPIAYHITNKWLENFAFKSTPGWWIFALAGILAIAISLLTVSLQTWRAASRNPVEALCYE